MVLQRSDVRKALLEKGFFKEPGRRHDKYLFYYNEKKTAAHALVSRGTSFKTLGDDPCLWIRKEMKLNTARELREFVSCKLTQAGYEKVLKDKKIIRDPA